MEMNDLVIVSVDDHVVEPPDAFLRHYPHDRKAEAPRIIEVDGKNVWLWNDKPYPTIGLNAVVGRPRSEYGMEPTHFDQLRPGCYDPIARVDDMNVNGILGSISFPSFPHFAGGTFIAAAKTDPEASLLGVRAYNDWHVHDWCGPAPERLIPQIILPVWDMDACVAELKRMSALGVHTITFPDNPSHVGLPSVHDTYWDPFWQACCDHEMILNCHIGTGIGAAHASDDSPIDAWITTMPMSISNAAADWLFATFWKRFPRLRMALSEGGIGWVPYFLERADFTHDHHHEWTFTDFGGERPSDLFRRHILTCFIDDQFGLANLKFMNVNMICYECDYPHSDSVWPNSPEFLWESAKQLTADVIDKITHLNAMREYYYHPFEAMGGRKNCTVGALRHRASHVDVSPRANTGGLKSDSMGADAKTRRPVTSGDLKRMFGST